MPDGDVVKFVSPSLSGAVIILGIGASEVALGPLISQLTGALGQTGTVGGIVNTAIYMSGAMVVFNIAAKQRGLVSDFLIGVGSDLGFRGVVQLLSLFGVNVRLGASLNI